ncbi:MAG: hypothetical protein J6K75_08465 [Erysipelotrichaceae bacterium]|nr:hypothetical protein [Erysipelotrichaceae bacterium]
MKSYWMWLKSTKEIDLNHPYMVLFRREFELNESVVEAKCDISADSKYKLYVNGQFVEFGPSKGDGEIWYYDTVDLKGYLKPGKNVIAVQVLRFPNDPFGGNQSTIVTAWPGLYFKSLLKTELCELDLSADEQWKCLWYRQCSVVGGTEGFEPLHFFERVRSDSSISNWNHLEYNDEFWEQAWRYPDKKIRYNVAPGNLVPRSIPMMFQRPVQFKDVIQSKGIISKEQWKHWVLTQHEIVVPAESEAVVELDIQEEMVAYLSLKTSGGKGSCIEILQSEAYVQNAREYDSSGAVHSVKKDRLDYMNGHLEGFKDVVWPSGLEETYEPFWFRTFRFVQLNIKTADEPLVLYHINALETGYPLEVKTHVEVSDPTLKGIWDLSERTLRRCMLETYVDCPFYEQLQYIMDTRAQILYTYAVSADDRLARKAIDDFTRGQRYDGLLNSAYPNTKPNVIPGFSLFYIFIIHDHMMYFGDKELIKDVLPSVEKVLRFFEKHRLENGLIGKTGSIQNEEKLWSFIDWCPQWMTGVPSAVKKGPLTIENLLVLEALKKASECARFVDKNELALEYEGFAESLAHAIRHLCMDQNGLLKDGPDAEEYSQHVQVFGVITHVLSHEEGRKNLLATFEQPERFAQCTVSWQYYLYRALELSDLYEKTEECYNIWRRMIANHMTTSAEAEAFSRSECHAWGALALYELPSVTLGVRPAAPGYGKVKVCPKPGYLSWAKGEVITPKGKVKVQWEKTESGFTCEVSADPEIEIIK